MIRMRGHHHFDHISADQFEGFGAVAEKGNTVFVHSVLGNDNASGRNWDRAVKTMEEAFSRVEDHGIIAAIGTFAEQGVLAPLGVQGVRVVGMAGGRTRHDDGVRWKESTVAENTFLVAIREQGWEFHNILFVPESGYAAIRAWRAEDATYPDSSHFIVRRCKFIGPGAIGTFTGKGIEDWGGNHHYLVEECEFDELEFAIVAPAGSPGIAAPLRDIIRFNKFEGNKNDICMDMSKGLVQGNIFRNAYNNPAHLNTINLAYVSDVSGANLVVDNHLGDATANIVIAKGFVPSTGDQWRNWVTDAADPIVAVPA
ncbi:MAG: hypothetical protein M0R06_12445 [Sphaerochaeta sp.]|nr:hypothetical protein [Sphaerochaeta sp.]